MKKDREEKYDFETTELETDELSLKINKNVKSRKKKRCRLLFRSNGIRKKTEIFF